MDLYPVQSSNIAAIGYDTRARRLAVRFRTGDTYYYSDVPLEEYQALVSAPSVGGHFHRRIKGRYGFTRGTSNL